MPALKIVEQLLDEFNTLSSQRYLWEAYWRDCTHYALPMTDLYEQAFQSGWQQAQTALMQAPAATRQTKDLYDQTSLWAIERLTAGLISLKTPESAHWHELDIDDPFGYDATDEEKQWMERLVKYLFTVRGSPRSGFWAAHKASVRSVCAYGDGFLYLEELFGRGPAVPWRYEFIPLHECYPGVDAMGIMDRMFRPFKLTAVQAVNKFGKENVSKELLSSAGDEKRKHDRYTILHCVVPRDEPGRGGIQGSTYASYYIEHKEKHLIRKGGYWEFPYIRHAWTRIGARPFCEGPMALALAEIKSLNELAMNELVSAQQNVRPPTASIGDNYTRVNLNPGVNNPGLLNAEGRLLVQPIVTAPRPDFAQTVLETRRNTVREMLYLNLWQTLIQDANQTATEALLRMQEKGELLGPVGIAFNEGLSSMVEREIGILGRKGAFNADSPLVAPDSITSRDIAPRYTSPLDRLRQSERLLGAQRMVEGMAQVAAAKQDPSIFARLDTNKYIELLQEGYGAPYELLMTKDEADKSVASAEQMQQTNMLLETLQRGGQAAEAMGRGGSAMAEGTNAVQGSDPMTEVMSALARANT